MVAICVTLPNIIPPDLVTELATIARMVPDNSFGGWEPSPDLLVQVPPHDARPFVVSAKPLKSFGAGPPVSAFSFSHLSPQKVTCWPTNALPLPITKLPGKNSDRRVPTALSDPLSSPLR